MSSNPLKELLSSTNESQLDEHRFASWRRERNVRISEEGSSTDREEDQNRIKASFRRLMDAYMCHVELDALGACALEKKVVVKHGEQVRKQKDLEYHCGKQLDRYGTCIESEEKVVTLNHAVASHKLCLSQREKFQMCIENSLDDPKLKPNELLQDHAHLPCDAEHRKLMRCGLNHLWHEYFRTINNVTDKEDFLEYRVDTSRDGLRGKLEKIAEKSLN